MALSLEKEVLGLKLTALPLFDCRGSRPNNTCPSICSSYWAELQQVKLYPEAIKPTD